MQRGILKEGSKLEDALAMSLDDILERRLQTMVYKMELSKSVKQARQLIVHGHIAVNGRRVTIPSYIVKRSEEDKIGYYDPNYGHNTG
jgi:small subunit ribosomal protein S4